MRGRWVEVALFVTLAFFAINQYPVFGASGPANDPGAAAYGVANDWAVGYLLSAIGLWIAGVVLYTLQAAGRRPAGDDLAVGLVVLGGGAFVASWTLQVAMDAPEEIYEIALAIVSTLVVLGIVVSASARRPHPSSDGEDDGDRGPPGPGSTPEAEQASAGETKVVVSRSEETVEEPVEGV